MNKPSLNDSKQQDPPKAHPDHCHVRRDDPHGDKSELVEPTKRGSQGAGTGAASTETQYTPGMTRSMTPSSTPLFTSDDTTMESNLQLKERGIIRLETNSKTLPRSNNTNNNKATLLDRLERRRESNRLSKRKCRGARKTSMVEYQNQVHKLSKEHKQLSTENERLRNELLDAVLVTFGNDASVAASTGGSSSNLPQDHRGATVAANRRNLVVFEDDDEEEEEDDDDDDGDDDDDVDVIKSTKVPSVAKDPLGFPHAIIGQEVTKKQARIVETFRNAAVDIPTRGGFVSAQRCSDNLPHKSHAGSSKKARHIVTTNTTSITHLTEDHARLPTVYTGMDPRNGSCGGGRSHGMTAALANAISTMGPIPQKRHFTAASAAAAVASATAAAAVVGNPRKSNMVSSTIQPNRLIPYNSIDLSSMAAALAKKQFARGTGPPPHLAMGTTGLSPVIGGKLFTLPSSLLSLSAPSSRMNHHHGSSNPHIIKKGSNLASTHVIGDTPTLSCASSRKHNAHITTMTNNLYYYHNDHQEEEHIDKTIDHATSSPRDMNGTTTDLQAMVQKVLSDYHDQHQQQKKKLHEHVLLQSPTLTTLKMTTTTTTTKKKKKKKNAQVTSITETPVMVDDEMIMNHPLVSLSKKDHVDNDDNVDTMTKKKMTTRVTKQQKKKKKKKKTSAKVHHISMDSNHHQTIITTTTPQGNPQDHSLKGNLSLSQDSIVKNHTTISTTTTTTTTTTTCLTNVPTTTTTTSSSRKRASPELVVVVKDNINNIVRNDEDIDDEHDNNNNNNNNNNDHDHVGKKEVLVVDDDRTSILI